MQQLTLFSKPDCHLCHDARDLLIALQREYDFSFEELDITQDHALEDKYRDSIPVIVIGSQLELAAPIHERELRAALKQNG